MKPKILVILGPTASGKSGLAVELALRFNGEVISADSRQVYTGLDIGTGKITQAEMKGVPHHLLDVADPSTERYTVSDWKMAAEKAVQDILSRGTPEQPKLPVICGGTGFYIDALLCNTDFPDVPHNEQLQKSLEKKEPAELVEILAQLDAERAANIDPKNRRRLIRAIEIATALGKVPEVTLKERTDWDILKIAIDTPTEVLRKKITDRLIARIDAGMIEEGIRLHTGTNTDTTTTPRAPLSYERMDELGLEYRYIAELMQSKLSRIKFVEILGAKIWQYSRRQMTWFRRDKTINWFSLKNTAEIEKAVSNFIKK
ncbi:MAG: tRNA delta(2)-isopentenylpyrophosphate transferase, tRNA dimethylallyltransferase [Candidatus Parcubacteria bacterium]|jgi:tRNA dimethylallyltransferase